MERKTSEATESHHYEYSYPFSRLQWSRLPDECWRLIFHSRHETGTRITCAVRLGSEKRKHRRPKESEKETLTPHYATPRDTHNDSRLVR